MPPNEAISFAQGQTRRSLDSNRMLVLSLVKSIEIVGEAAARVAKDCQDQHPSIPWRDIIGMRNRLVHAYFEVDLDRVWDTVTDDLPPLVKSLELILSPEDPDA